MKIYKNVVLFLFIGYYPSFAEEVMDMKNFSHPDLLPLIRVIKSSMKSVMLVSSNVTETQHLFSLMSEIVPIPTTVINKDQLTSVLTTLIQTHLVAQSIKQLRSQLNFVVIGDFHNFKSVVNIADDLDKSVGFGSTLRHFSKWIWFRDQETMTDLPALNTSLDNIAVISKRRNDTVDIATLLWRPTRREWSPCPPYSTNTSDLNIHPNTKFGLNGRLLKIAILEWIPYSRRHSIDGSVVYNGSACDAVEQLATTFNFSIEYVEPEDRQWGQITNDSWTGIVGMLQRREVDMCAVPYIINIERSKVMTFTFPTAYSYQSALYRKSEDDSRHWTVLVSCFRLEVYLYGFAVIVSIVAMLLLFRHIYKEEHSVLDVILLGISVPFHQAGLLPTRLSSSSKVLVSSWCLFCVIITSVYTGNLIAQLSVSREHVPFRTLEEIGEQDTFEVSVATGTYIELLLKMSKAPELKEIWNKIIHYGESTTGNAEFLYHTQRLLQGRYVLLIDEQTADRLTSQNCDLTKLPAKFLPAYVALPFPKLSPLAELFAGQLMAMTENGMISTWFNNWNPQQKRCPFRRKTFQLQLRDLLSVLVGLAIASSLSFIVLLVECALGKIRVWSP